MQIFLKEFDKATSFGSDSTATKIIYRIIELSGKTDAKDNFRITIREKDDLVATLARRLEQAFAYKDYKEFDDPIKNDIRETIARKLLAKMSEWDAISKMDHQDASLDKYDKGLQYVRANLYEPLSGGSSMQWVYWEGFVFPNMMYTKTVCRTQEESKLAEDNLSSIIQEAVDEVQQNYKFPSILYNIR